MTSFRAPDHDVRISLSGEEFDLLSGTEFSVKITPVGERNSLKGMLIIPRGNNQPDDLNAYQAWLWIDNKPAPASLSDILICIQSSCDPMIMPEEEIRLEKFYGTTFEASIAGYRQCSRTCD